MLNHLLIYIFSFAAFWIGSGIAIKSVTKLSQYLKISSFLISFIVLGIFTSISEFSVGVNSIIEKNPEIFVGNLIGASIVIFLLIIPLLAIAGKEIKIKKEFLGFNLVTSLFVVAVPVFLILDGEINRLDSILTIALYAFLVVSLQFKKGVFENVSSLSVKRTIEIGKELLKIIFSVVIIFIASRLVVDQTLYLSSYFKISPFLISLLVIGIGTNIPELSLVVRSTLMKNHQVAFGDYIGSAAFNTFLVGFLTLVNGQTIYLTNTYLTSLLILVAGLGMFFIFSRSKNSISRLEALALLSLYLVFVTTEIIFR